MGKRLGMGEFIALIAFLFMTIALGIDMMLPALPQIAADLSVENINHTQLVITVFVFGTGLGQLVAGPLSDALGRKVVLGGGLLISIVAFAWCLFDISFTTLLIARFVQGLGISAPRSVGLALVRDIYEGRKMARVISLAMLIFILAPAVAPLIGQTIMLAFSWVYIFAFLMLMGLLCFLWLTIRQEETHPVAKRRPFTLALLRVGFIEVLTNKRTVVSIVVLSLVYGMLFAFLSSAQQIFVDWLDTGTKFPIYFAIIALVGAFSNATNAALVERLGMWVISTFALGIVSVLSIAAALIFYWGIIPESHLLLAFMTWACCLFFLLTLCFGNLNSLALEPMGHIAGLASAIVGFCSTTACLLIAIPIGQMYNGTGLPLIVSGAVIGLSAFLMNLINPRLVD